MSVEAAARSAPVRRLDEAKVRAEFPILARPARGRRLAYLDSAATAQKPRRVLQAMNDFYVTRYANVHRGVHILSEESTAAYDRARELARQFLGAPAAEEVIFTSGTTDALNLVAHSFAGASLQGGDEIVLTTYEHHSNIVPWQIVAHRVGAGLRVIPLTPDGALDMDAARVLIGPRTRVVAVSHVSNVLGSVTPVAELARMAHKVGAVLVVDGAQAAPHLPVNVRTLGCDFYACSGHKMYGPTAIGILWGRAELLKRMPPWITGGGMIERVSFEATSYAPPPARFEAGTPPIAEAVGLGAAIEYLTWLGMPVIAAHQAELLEYAMSKLAAVPELRIVGTAPDKVGVVSFVMGEIHPHDLATVLDDHGIAVRAGHHCAQPLMQHLGLPATVRASFGLYNTREDVDQLVAGLHEARKRFGR